MEDKTYAVPFTYASAHATLAGLGAMIMLLGDPPPFLAPMLEALVSTFGLSEEGDFDHARAKNAADVDLTLEQYDVALSAMACLHAMVKMNKITHCPHTETQIVAWGEEMDKGFTAARIEAGR